MSGEVVNLRMTRKAKMRVEVEQAAAENRVRFGRTKAERVAEEQAAARARRKVDGAELER